MANSLNQVKTRIASTKNTAQITKAMYMVSQSKVKRSEKTYREYKDFMQRIASMVSLVVSKTGEEYQHPLLTPREVKKTAYLVITSDKGLAGAYNNGLLKAFTEKLNETHTSKDEYVVGAIGKKGFSYINKMKYPLIDDKPTFVRASANA